ncbi:MAG: response regulator transcription factor [Gemmatimonadaceae bacterium]|jgi:DNA-binding response OmpR family regulator|nr:response regulator transcription factor [Gemmatimonadaceae bacterium]
MTTATAAPTRRASVLVVEDDAKTADLVALYLGHAGHRVSIERSGSRALERLRTETFDLLVLDIMLPGVSGLQLAEHVRATATTPVIFLTARTIEEDRLHGFAVGADDYVTKPFSPRELVARVEAVLRRSPPGDAPPLRHADLEVHQAQREVRVGGHSIDLTPSEYAVLVALLARPGIVFSRAELLDRLPNDGAHALDRTVDVHVSNIRRKLAVGALGSGYIETVFGAGYRVPQRPAAGRR